MNSLLKIAATVIALFVSATVSAASMDMTTWSKNGHTYKIIYSKKPLTWKQAKAAAEKSTYKGMHGYLASLTSAAEYNYVVGKLKPKYSKKTPSGWKHGPWIGGYNNGKGWKWVSGEKFDIKKWLAGEPNGNGGVKLLYLQIAQHKGKTGLDDVPNSGYKYNYSYIIEYNKPSAVPIPASAFLLAPAFVGFIGLRRKAIKAA